MVESTWKKLTVAKYNAKFMTDGIQLFPRTVIGVLESVHAWDQMGFATKYENKLVDVYLVYAYNAGYFKSDGQSICVQVCIHDKISNDAWLETCLCSWNNKESVEDTKNLMNRIESYVSLSTEEIQIKRDDKKVNYPWQIAGEIDGLIGTYDAFRKKDIAKKIPTPLSIAEKFSQSFLSADKKTWEDLLSKEIENYHTLKSNQNF